MIVPKHYENLNVLHENTMPNRSYYIPASKVMQNLVEHREESDRFQLLNGEWNFQYYDGIYDLQDAFYETGYDVSGFGTIPVPGMWQNAGFDTHQYSNIRYPFPFDPPYVPQDNPCGAYVYDFDYEKAEQAPNAYLLFEGVDSCFYVWLNGRYVGYSQVSHSTSEFDVTDYLVEGKNRIAVLVMKWCDGSYLEDQDKFRMTGIFNDVYLLKRPENVIFDYFVKTECADKTAKIYAEITYLKNEVPTKVSLLDKEGNVVESKKIAGGEGNLGSYKDTEASGDSNVAEMQQDMNIFEKSCKVNITFEVQNPVLWNAENPYLYTLVFETEQEVITERVGIRQIYIENKVVYINGQSIVFRGVNRHDSDPETGFVTGMEKVKRDLQIMRQHNVNAIRTSHYPNAPYFYQLCDEYGFYVIGEADNESHGTSELFFEDNDFSNVGKRWNERISNNPDFNEATLDRIQRCVQREKNRPSVVIWSMGNECAYGCTIEGALQWTKEFDDTRLTHFESALHHGNDRKYDFSNLDLFSRMYPSLEEMHEYLDSNPDKPYILCEYCHAMGNGPGDLEDYFQMFHSDERLCGGFVWEWCDHAIAHGKAANGKTVYYYGGDHGEILHDGNFCSDGLVYPDRRPHTGLMEYKNVHRPVRVVSFEQKDMTIQFHNYLDFTNAQDAIRMRYEVNCDGSVIEKGVLETPFMEPHQEATVSLPVSVPDTGKVFLKIYYDSIQGTSLIPEGYALGFDEVALENADGRHKIVVQNLEHFGKEQAEIQIEENDTTIFINGSQFAYCLDKRTGLFTKLSYNGEDMLMQPMEVNIWRAPTDNDRNIKNVWQRAKYDMAAARAYDATIERKDNVICIHCSMSLGAKSVQRILNMDTTWTIDANGAISLSMDVLRHPEFPMLPRFGLRMFLKANMDQVTYYGMGPIESYCDKHRASSHDTYSMHTLELHEDYIRPQENGSHYDCSYVSVESDSYSLTAISETGFSFNNSVYTQEELMTKNHNYELEASGYSVLCLDYAQNGIGSNSCGPQVLEDYRLDAKEFNFAITLIPCSKQR